MSKTDFWKTHPKNRAFGGKIVLNKLKGVTQTDQIWMSFPEIGQAKAQEIEILEN